MSDTRKKRPLTLRFTKREIKILERLKEMLGLNRNQCVVLSAYFTYVFWDCVKPFSNRLALLAVNDADSAYEKEKRRISAQISCLYAEINALKADANAKKCDCSANGVAGEPCSLKQDTRPATPAGKQAGD